MDFKPTKLVNKTKRVGRGPASGKGKTSGRGMNGQRSRTGSSTAFQEGGQTSFVMRLPKAKGFKAISKETFSISVRQLQVLFPEAVEISASDILKKLKLEKKFKNVKVFGASEKEMKFKFDESIRTSKSLATK